MRTICHRHPEAKPKDLLPQGKVGRVNDCKVLEDGQILCSLSIAQEVRDG